MMMEHYAIYFMHAVMTKPTKLRLRAVSLLKNIAKSCYITLLVYAGLHVLSSESAQIPWFDSVFADIGDEQSLSQSLSTFSGHLKQISVRILPLCKCKSSAFCNCCQLFTLLFPCVQFCFVNTFTKNILKRKKKSPQALVLDGI